MHASTLEDESSSPPSSSADSANAHAQAGKANQYWTAYCFTGFGQQSVKSINLMSKDQPSISDCKKLYPDTDQHSLANLRKRIEELKKTQP